MNYNSFSKFLIFLIICSFMVTSTIQARKIKEAEAIEITVDSPDSIELVGYLYLPQKLENEKVPLVILLHQMRMDHKIWADLVNYIANEGMAVFAMDLRGHGYSIYDIAKHKIKPKWQISANEFLLYPSDVQQIVDSTLSRYNSHLDKNNLAIVGASIGANTALLFAQKNPTVKYTALLSPGLNYRGLKISEAVQRAILNQHPLYIAVAGKDVYSHTSCALLSDITHYLLDVEVFDNYWHGNDLLNKTPALRSRILSDLIKYLKK